MMGRFSGKSLLAGLLAAVLAWPVGLSCASLAAAAPIAGPVVPAAKPVILAAPEVKASRHSDTAIQLRWKPVAGADGYRIYRWSNTAKAYLKVKTIQTADIKDQSATIRWVDGKLKTRTEYKYHVKAFTRTKQGTVFSPASLWVSAITYHREDSTVNAGEIHVKDLTIGLWGYGDIVTWTFDDPWIVEAALSSTSVEDGGFGPSYWGTTYPRYPVDKKLRFVQVSGFDSAKVTEDGQVEALGKPGKVKIRAYAHNGNYATTTLTVKDYARKPAFSKADDFTVALAGDNEAIVLLMQHYRKQAGQVAAYLVEHKTWGTITLGPNMVLDGDAELDTQGQQLLIEFLDDFPYDLEIYATPYSLPTGPTVEFSATANVTQTGKEEESILTYNAGLMNSTYLPHHAYPADHWNVETLADVYA